jgi:hypothetical protein
MYTFPQSFLAILSQRTTMKSYNFLLLLLPLTFSLSAMENKSTISDKTKVISTDNSCKEPTQGPALILDRVGTTVQHTAFPAVIARSALNNAHNGTDNVVAIVGILCSILANEGVIHAGTWILDWPRTTRIKTFPEPANAEKEKLYQYWPRKIANGAIHLTNQAIKITTSLAPLVMLMNLPR